MASEGLRGGNKQGGRVASQFGLTSGVCDPEEMEVAGLLWQSIVLGGMKCDNEDGAMACGELKLKIE